MIKKNRISTIFALLSIVLTSCGANTVPQDYEFNADVASGASGAYYEIFVRTFADSDDGMMVGEIIYCTVQLNSPDNIRAELVAQIAPFDEISDKIAHHHLGVVA